MAITIIRNPIAYAPAYNKNEVTCSSTNVAQPSFSFVFELYDGATLLSKQYIPAEPLYGYGVLDINKIMESYVTTNFFGFTDGIETKNCPDCHADFDLKIGERYAVAGVMTEFLNLANVSGDVFNGSLLQKDFINFDITDYELTGTTKQFLTTNIRKTVALTTQGYLNFYNDNPPAEFRVIAYDSAGSVLKDATFANTATSEIAMVPSAPVNLNLVTPLTGTQPFITAATSYYTLFAQNGGVASQVYTFDVVDCEKVTLHFLTDLGGFESFVFNAAAKINWKFEKEYYKKDPNVLQSDGTIVYSQMDREWVNYYVSQVKSMRLVSDWISDEQSVWLRQMYSSPEIYAQIGSEMITLKGIKELGYEEKSFEYNDLFNIELNIDFSVDNYRQRF